MRAKLTFEHDLNASLQVGDSIWYAPTTQSGNYNVTSTNSNSFALLGQVTSVSSQYKLAEIEVEIPGFDLPQDLGLVLDNTTYIMFSKNKKINSSDLKGYYAEINLVNNSTEKIELFAIGSSIAISSK
tara:strand:+ start:960 stop:1343 length:384 start_codon:yes stop_codon:yes gene_type:complete